MNSPSAQRAPTYTLEDEARKIVGLAKAVRGIIKAPPDPKPRHRLNILFHRIAEIDTAIENLHAAQRKLREAIEG